MSKEDKNIRCQDCNICEYKEMGCPEDGHCYMFKNKPEGRCAPFKPILPKEEQEQIDKIRKLLSGSGWGKFL